MMRHPGTVGPDGMFRPWNHQRWLDWFRARKGQRVEIETRDESAIRSNRQNRYWFGVCIPFVQECWQREQGSALPLPKEAVHDALVSVFGGEWMETPLGKARRSSSSMNTEEFSKLIDAVREYALQKYGAHIPTPEEWSDA